MAKSLCCAISTVRLVINVVELEVRERLLADLASKAFPVIRLIKDIDVLPCDDLATAIAPSARGLSDALVRAINLTPDFAVRARNRLTAMRALEAILMVVLIPRLKRERVNGATTDGAALARANCGRVALFLLDATHAIELPAVGVVALQGRATVSALEARLVVLLPLDVQRGVAVQHVFPAGSAGPNHLGGRGRVHRRLGCTSGDIWSGECGFAAGRSGGGDIWSGERGFAAGLAARSGGGGGGDADTGLCQNGFSGGFLDLLFLLLFFLGRCECGDLGDEVVEVLLGCVVLLVEILLYGLFFLLHSGGVCPNDEAGCWAARLGGLFLFNIVFGCCCDGKLFKIAKKIVK